MDQAPEKKNSLLQVGEPSTTEYLDWDLIGSRIKTQRETRGLTQKQLADKIGTTKQTISNYESGKCKMTKFEALPNICELAKGLGCLIEYLLGEVPTAGILLITKTGEIIHKDSLSYLPSEEQQKIRNEYNHRKDNGEFPNPNPSLNPDTPEPIPKYLVHKEYELIPIADSLESELKDRLFRTYKQAVSSVYKGQLYFYNSENNTAFCLKPNKQGPPTLYEIKNPEFTHQLPHLVKQFDEHLCNKKQEIPGANIQVAYDFAALLDLIMFARRNPDFFACMENFTKKLLFSVKNNDEYKTIDSFLSNYQNHASLFQTFLKTIETLPEEKVLKNNSDKTIASFLSNYQNHASLFQTFLRTIEILSEEELLRLEKNLLKLNNQYANN